MIFINPEAFVNRNTPNLNLAYAATYYNIPVIDLNTKPEPRKRYLLQETDILGISIQTRTYQQSLKIKKQYLKKHPESIVKSIRGPLDIQCCYQFIDFPEMIDSGLKFSDDLPFPDYELFDSFPVFQKNWSSSHWPYTIMTSLGCPFSCTYCSAKNRGWKTRSSKNCFDELQEAKKKWGIKSFKILDDCFNLQQKRVIDFCQTIKPLGLPWSCVNGLRADLFTESTAKIMSEAGCTHIGFGIESANPLVLKQINKGETIEQIEQAIKIAKKYFTKINGFLIIGLPGSSYESDLASLNWAKKLNIQYNFSYYIPEKDQRNKAGIFWGEAAKPFSDEYPKKLQKKIYQAAQTQMGRKVNLFSKINKKLKKMLSFKNIFYFR